MTIPFFQVDAFTATAFGGNPAAVCLLTAAADSAWMQSVAAEMNLPETSFVRRMANGFELRWFTPLAEVDLCGHATLAAAHALYTVSEDATAELRFETRSGPLIAKREGRWIALDFPSQPATVCPIPSELESALGVEPVFGGRNQDDFFATSFVARPGVGAHT